MEHFIKVVDEVNIGPIFFHFFLTQAKHLKLPKYLFETNFFSSCHVYCHNPNSTQQRLGLTIQNKTKQHHHQQQQNKNTNNNKYISAITDPILTKLVIITTPITETTTTTTKTITHTTTKTTTTTNDLIWTKF